MPALCAKYKVLLHCSEILVYTVLPAHCKWKPYVFPSYCANALYVLDQNVVPVVALSANLPSLLSPSLIIITSIYERQKAQHSLSIIFLFFIQS